MIRGRRSQPVALTTKKGPIRLSGWLNRQRVSASASKTTVWSASLAVRASTWLPQGRRRLLQEQKSVASWVAALAQGGHERPAAHRERGVERRAGLADSPTVGVRVLEHQQQPIDARISLFLHHRPELRLDVAEPREEFSADANCTSQLDVEGTQVYDNPRVALQDDSPTSGLNLAKESRLERELGEVAKRPVGGIQSHPQLATNDRAEPGEVGGADLRVLGPLDSAGLRRRPAKRPRNVGLRQACGDPRLPKLGALLAQPSLDAALSFVDGPQSGWHARIISIRPLSCHYRALTGSPGLASPWL